MMRALLFAPLLALLILVAAQPAHAQKRWPGTNPTCRWVANVAKPGAGWYVCQYSQPYRYDMWRYYQGRQRR